MNPELAMIVALVIHGNIYIRGDQALVAPNLVQSIPVFKKYDVQFARKKKILFFFNQEQVISGTDSWLKDIREKNAKRIWFLNVDVRKDLPDRIASSFQGGGSWAVQVDYESSSEVWVPNWSTNKVVFKCLVYDKVLPVENPKTAEAEGDLMKALEAARGFSAEIKFAEWTRTFTEILRRSKDLDFGPDGYLKIIPDGKDHAKERRLLSIALESWVFGGMGSWNDLPSYGDALDKEYEKISNEFYAAEIEAFKTGANRFSD